MNRTNRKRKREMQSANIKCKKLDSYFKISEPIHNSKNIFVMKAMTQKIFQTQPDENQEVPIKQEKDYTDVSIIFFFQIDIYYIFSQGP